MNPTSIPWCDLTWNPITGCTKGCDYCYAQKIAARFGKQEQYSAGDIEDSVAEQGYWEARDNAYSRGIAFPAGFAPTTYPHRLDEPLRRTKPSTIFMGSMGDLFDPAFPDEFRDRVFMTTLLAKQHTFLLLTKQSENMRRYFSDPDRASAIFLVQPNLWLGVTVTNQADADERIPLLLDTPAAHRFVSVEPMLGPVDLRFVVYGDLEASWRIDALSGKYGVPSSWNAPTQSKLDLVIAGGKTPGKPLHERIDDSCFSLEAKYSCPAKETIQSRRDLRSCQRCEEYELFPLEALRSLRDQCLAADVPLHYKHGGTNPALDGVVYGWKPGDAS